MVFARVNHQWREQGQRTFCAFACTDQDTAGRAPLPRLEREDRDSPGPVHQGAENGAQALWLMDQGQPTTGGEPPEALLYKRLKICRPLPMGAVAARIGRRSRVIGAEEGWVGDDMVDTFRAQIPGQGLYVGGHDCQRQVVSPAVFAGKISVMGLDLHPCRNGTRHTGQQAEGRNADTAAEFQNCFAGSYRCCGGQKHRIGGGAIAFGGLKDPQAPAEKGVVGDLHRLSGRFDFIISQDRTGPERILAPDHHPPRQYANGAFQDAHMDVHHKAFYILPTQQRCGKGNDRRIVCAQDLFHGGSVAILKTEVETQRDDAVTPPGPFERLQAMLAPEMERVNALIADRMASEHAPRIPEVTAHLVHAGGKRLRPLLTLAAARLFDYPGEHHVRLAATVEFIHTATLLHDDVVDESEQRRGRPTANLLWDNQSSVLVGDYLFSRAFQLMVETESLRVLDILANASAVIAEGEVLQLSAAQNIATTEATYMQVIRGKTAALFAAATEVGGVIAGADEAHVTALRSYGDALGISFQLVDDLLDYGGVSKVFGKNIGDDFRERKMSLPVIRAVAAADAEERAFWARVIDKGNQRDGDLDHALELMARHGALEATRNAALHWGSEARKALDTLPESDLQTLLQELADFVVARAV